MEKHSLNINCLGLPCVTIGGKNFAFECKFPSTSCPKCYTDGKYTEKYMIPCSVSECRRSIHAYHGAIPEFTSVDGFVICTG